MHKVFITGKINDIAINVFNENTDIDLEYIPDCPREQIFEKIGDKNILVTRSETRIDKELIDAAKSLKMICRAAVGVANIDIDYATEKGILIVNCPGKNTNSAAELTMGLLLSLMRRIPQGHSHMKSGKWDRHLFHGFELKGKKIGIVGLGNVGHRVAKFAHGFDMEVLGYDPYISPTTFQKHRVKQYSDLKEMAGQVDIISVHTPLNSETRGMINAEVIGCMPKGGYLVNAARGGVIDEEDMVAALSSGQISRIGLDTFNNEPTPYKELIDHPEVVCTPHIGAITIEAQVAIAATVAEEVVKFIEGQVVSHPVNLPEVSVISDPVIKSYSVLAERLGSLAAQCLDFSPVKATLLYRGDLADKESQLIKLGFMKGFASRLRDDFVSFVNAESHFQQMGIDIIEEHEQSFGSYKSALKIIVEGNDKKLKVGGVVFDELHSRLTLFNNYHFEAEASGPMLLCENKDVPGVVGRIGTFLGDHKININTFDLSRNKDDGCAFSVIRLDNKMAPKQLESFKLIENIITAKCVQV